VITRFLDHPLFKMMMLPTRRGLRMLNVATQPILRSIGRVVGGDVLADAIAFFQAFDGMETGFRRRADEVLTLLRSDVTHYVLVASPRGDTVDEAAYFAERLRAAAGFRNARRRLQRDECARLAGELALEQLHLPAFAGAELDGPAIDELATALDVPVPAGLV
jgi:hypothetical protein